MCTNAGGGSGGGASKSAANTISTLEGVRENSRQFTAARQAAESQKAAVLEFENIMGKVDKLYFNGATWSNTKPSDTYLGGFGRDKRKGTYKAKFKAPKSWGKNYDFG